MTIQLIRQTVLDEIVAALDGVVQSNSIRKHRGRFDSIDEIRHIAARSPSVLVAVKGVLNEVKRYDYTTGDVMFVVYVLTSNKGGADRSDRGGVIAETISRTMAKQSDRWDFTEDEIKKLNRIDVTSLAIDKMGIALWEITWLQKCKIENDSTALADIFVGFDADHYGENDSIVNDDPMAQTSVTYPEP